MGIDTSEVAAVVLHFRTPSRTLTCLRSLVDEGVRRIVLVDNSEDDGESLANMDEGLQALRNAGVRVESITPVKNLGFAKGVNVGLMRVAELGARATLLINSDARMEAGALRALLTGIDDADVAVPRVRGKPGAPLMGLLSYYQSATAILFREARFGCVWYPSGCCLLLRMEIVKLPLFDEDFFFYGVSSTTKCNAFEG